MSPPTAKVKLAPAQSALTPEQRAWLKRLGTVVGADGESGTAQPVAAARGTQSAGSQAGAAPKAFAIGLGPSDIPGLLGKVAGPLKCTCTIQNNTDQTFVLDPTSRNEIDDDSGKTMGIAHGEYQEFPPSVIKGGEQNAKFVAVNKDLDIIIVDVHPAGAEGFVRYFLDDQKKTSLTIHFDNPRVGSNKGDARIEGPNAKKFNPPQAVVGGGNEGVYLYVVDPSGGVKPNPAPPGPGPKPNPAPGPAPTDVQGSCLITVNNNTNLVLNLADQGHDRGDFMTLPPQSIQPGGSAQFASVQTPQSKEPGCKGFVSWEVGSPAAAIWRCEWDNPEGGEKNNAKGSAEPQSAGFRTVAQIGEGDQNVPTVFTISGGGAGPLPTPPSPGPNPPPGPNPGPNPPPPPSPDPPFNPPPGSRQPTLRRGDQSPDGWVEYLQQMLNANMGPPDLAVDGNFGPATEKVVRAFQAKNKLMVDGIVGNQTWAALREGTPEAPSTDGRQPHTFEEKGPQARWDQEKSDAIYLTSDDELEIFAVSVGEQPIDDFSATVRITPPNTKPKTVQVKIGPAVTKTKTDQGDPHIVRLANFKKNFPAKDPKAKLEDYLVEAFFDKELGGDLFKGNIVVV